MREPVIHAKQPARRALGRLISRILFYLLVISIFFSLVYFVLGFRSKNDPSSSPPRAFISDVDGQVSDVLINEGELANMNFATDDIAFDDRRKSFPRIFCMVPSQPHARAKFVKILDTWGKWCDGLQFMIDPPTYAEAGKEHLLPEEEVEFVTSSDGRHTAQIVLLNKLVRKKGNSCFTGGTALNPKTGKQEPVYTMCRHIWEKVWRSWVYVADHHSQNYDFFFKVDDDTFFFVPVMREVILQKGWGADEHHYFGQRVFPIGPERGLIAGALVGFSRHTLHTLVNDAYKKMEHEYGDRKNFKHGRCVDRDGATEEVTTSICAGQVGAKPEALYDETVVPRRPHMLLWMPRDMLTFTRRDNSSSWFYKHAPRDVGTLENCCSDRPVGFHFMRLDEDLQRVYDLIVDPEGKRELETVVETKVPQWEASQARRTTCTFDPLPFPPSTCILEAKYLLSVKKTWHARDAAKHYEPRLGG